MKNKVFLYKNISIFLFISILQAQVGAGEIESSTFYDTDGGSKIGKKINLDPKESGMGQYPLYLAKGQNSASTSAIGGISGWIRDSAGWIPGNWGIAVKTFLETMRPETYGSDSSVGMANRGLLSFFVEELGKESGNNYCFRNLANSFFSNASIFGPTPKKSSLVSKIEDVGKKPGWVWEEAIAKTGGNPNLALKLIALCGNDDVLEYAYGQDVHCPESDYNFFYPEGLGPGIDVSPQIKKYVIETQSIHADAANIKSKNYHIYSGAFLACQMIENGVDPGSVGDISQKFAFAYRRIRTCRTAFDMFKEHQDEEAAYQKALKDYNRAGAKGKQPSRDRFFGHEGAAASTRRKRIIDTFLASKVYIETTDCPISSVGEKAEILKAASAKVSSIYKDSLYLPSDFDERCGSLVGSKCGDVRKVLDTWDADFKWSMDQQRVGAEFAAKHCKPKEQLKAYGTPPLCAGSGKTVRTGPAKEVR